METKDLREISTAAYLVPTRFCRHRVMHHNRGPCNSGPIDAAEAGHRLKSAVAAPGGDRNQVASVNSL